MKQNFPKPIKIKIFYDGELKKITGKSKEIAWVSEGMTFAFFLYTIFRSYPEIENKYPPGILGLLLNDRPPGHFDVLKDGDEILLKVCDAANIKFNA
ncbi:MAG: hypothetical protein AB1465_07430 [Patescibacteria group bacterium]